MPKEIEPKSSQIINQDYELLWETDKHWAREQGFKLWDGHKKRPYKLYIGLGF